MFIFKEKGYQNTHKTAELVADYVKEHGIKYVVLASKTGYTTDIFLDTFEKAAQRQVYKRNPLLRRLRPRTV